MKPKPAKRRCRSSWSINISSVAVIGGGLCGLTAAIRLAEAGVKVTLFEASPKAGGRTRSFFDTTVSELCDNGPHLLIGAYSATEQLLSDCGASDTICWQQRLQLPCWEAQRGYYALQPKAWLPMALALPLAVAAMPGHGFSSAMAMLRIGLRMHRSVDQNSSVATWMQRCGVSEAVMRDMIEPLCLGAMNEHIETASAASFLQVLKESFASHKTSRLGWFTAPMDKALITPLVKRAEKLGVMIITSSRIKYVDCDAQHASVAGEQFDRIVVALPAYATDKLLGNQSGCATETISNLHIWLDQPVTLNGPFVGGIGTHGEWFFDISSQMHETGKLQHLCGVISADNSGMPEAELLKTLCSEIEKICGSSVQPVHHRLVREKRATVLVRPYAQPQLPDWLIDASERPLPGELPATIEMAVRRGEKAAKQCLGSMI